MTPSDHEQLRQLALLYCHAWLMRDDDLMTSLWHRDRSPAAEGELDAYWVDGLLPRWRSLGTTMLHVTNHLIAVDGDRAEGRVYCLAQLDRGEELQEQTIVYEDRCIRVDGRWLFSRRRHLLWFGESRPNPLVTLEPSCWPQSQVGTGTIPQELTPFPWPRP